MQIKAKPDECPAPCGKPECRIVGVYVVFAGIWIFFSDRALTFFTTDLEKLQRWQTFKGWAFVLITALLLYTLLKRAFSERERFEKCLRRSEARFRQFLDANIIGIMIADVHGHIHEANGALLLMLGYSREELQAGNLRWDALTPGEHKEGDQAALEHCLATGSAHPTAD